MSYSAVIGFPQQPSTLKVSAAPLCSNHRSQLVGFLQRSQCRDVAEVTHGFCLQRKRLWPTRRSPYVSVSYSVDLAAHHGVYIALNGVELQAMLEIERRKTLLWKRNQTRTSIVAGMSCCGHRCNASRPAPVKP